MNIKVFRAIEKAKTYEGRELPGRQYAGHEYESLKRKNTSFKNP